jgi:hypothetical protein
MEMFKFYYTFSPTNCVVKKPGYPILGSPAIPTFLVIPAKKTGLAGGDPTIIPIQHKYKSQVPKFNPILAVERKRFLWLLMLFKIQARFFALKKPLDVGNMADNGK